MQYSAAALPDAITTPDEQLLKEAMASPERSLWVSAIEEEFKSLGEYAIWRSSKPLPGVRPLPTGVILRPKRDAAGRPARFKARLVARGNLQEDAVDYPELYSPVACIELVRTMLAIARAKGWEVDHVDVKGAFLHATFPKEDRTWVRLPTVEGVPSVSSHIVQLNKSLYGLRQAPKHFYEHFSSEVAAIKLTRSNVTDCMFTRGGESLCYVIVYVDDLMIIRSERVFAQVKKDLARLFTVTDLVKCSYFLGIKIYRTDSGMHIAQEVYGRQVVQRLPFAHCKPNRSPLPLAHPLYEERQTLQDFEKTEMQDMPFRSVLGVRLYLATRTRPDLATAVSLLDKFQADPGPQHWRMLRHLVRYVAGTTDYGQYFPIGKGALDLVAWSDADWARDLTKRRSRTGYLLTLNEGPIVWGSRLQSATAESTTEAEFAALQV